MQITVFLVIGGVLLFLAIPVGFFFTIKYLIGYNAKMKAKYNAHKE